MKLPLILRKARINQWRIRNRVLFLAIVPMFLTAILIGYYLTVIHIQSESDSLDRVGQSICQGLAQSSEFALLIKDTEGLKALSNSAFIHPDIERVVIRGSDGKILTDRSKTKEGNRSGIRVFRQDIFLQPSEKSDVDEELRGKDQKEEFLGSVEVYVSNKGLVHERSRFITQVVLITLIGLGISIIISASAAQSLIAPLTNILNVVEQVIHGNLATSVNETSGGEVGRLERGINTMVQTIAAAQNNLQSEVTRATARLEQSIRQMRRKNVQLIKSEQRAHEASRAKERFLAQISHELRTPLTSIIGFSELLASSATTPSQKEWSGIIKQAGNHLHRVINDVLCYSELKAAKADIVKVPFDPEPIIEDAVSLHSVGAHEKKIEIVFLRLRSTPRIIEADPDRLTQVMNNLLSNAVKFTDRGTILVTAAVDENTKNLLVSVEDSGIGISDDVRPRLFQPFIQGDGSIRKSFGGTGLGLTISKMLIEDMGGEIWVGDTEIGGAKISFTLPAADVSDHPLHESELRPLRGYKVLIVDSSPYNRKALLTALMRYGASPFLARTIDLAHRMVVDAAQGEEPFDTLIVGCGVDDDHTKINDDLRVLTSNTSNLHLVILAATESMHESLQRVHMHSSRVSVCTKPTPLPRLLELIRSDGGAARDGGQEHPGFGLSHPPTLSMPFFYGAKVLLAEDNEFSRKLIRIRLQEFGVTVEECENGQEAITRAQTNPYDMIFLDIHMPVVDGYGACERIRQDSQNIATPIIAITADVFAEAREDRVSNAFTDVTLKPISKDRLEVILRDHLKSKAGKRRDEQGGTAHAPERVSQSEIRDQIRRLFDLVLEAYDCLDREEMKRRLHDFNGIVGYAQQVEILDVSRYLEQSVLTIPEDDITTHLSRLESAVYEMSVNLRS